MDFRNWHVKECVNSKMNGIYQKYKMNGNWKSNIEGSCLTEIKRRLTLINGMELRNSKCYGNSYIKTKRDVHSSGIWGIFGRSLNLGYLDGGNSGLSLGEPIGANDRAPPLHTEQEPLESVEATLVKEKYRYQYKHIYI